MKFVFFCIAVLWASPSLAQTRVIDGDTLDVDGVRYRLEGIDAPEASQMCQSKAGLWACGTDATEKLEELVTDAQTVCQGSEDDGNGRIIARCRANGVDLGKALVDSGYAWAFRRYSLTYVDQETKAKAQGLGIWSVENEPAWQFRRKRWDFEAQTSPNGCAIKGNKSDNGWIYHLPWMRDYHKTRISTEKGERWFCTEAEALEAGWRAPLRY